MAIATQTPSPRLLVPSHSEQRAANLVAAPASPKPFWRDWVAMFFWTACFALMAIIHLVNLVIGYFR